MPASENRWTVDQVRCLDCNTVFTPGSIDRDVDRPLGEGARILLILMPEVCPSCHNLKAVEEPT